MPANGQKQLKINIYYKLIAIRYPRQNKSGFFLTNSKSAICKKILSLSLNQKRTSNNSVKVFGS